MKAARLGIVIVAFAILSISIAPSASADAIFGPTSFHAIPTGTGNCGASVCLPLSDGPGRRIFIAQGFYWMIYNDGYQGSQGVTNTLHYKYRSASIAAGFGANWGPPSPDFHSYAGATVFVRGLNHAITTDGTFVYVVIHHTNNGTLMFVRGTLGAGGISFGPKTWFASNVNIGYLSVSLDSTGLIWVFYVGTQGPGGVSIVMRSNNAAGTSWPAPPGAGPILCNGAANKQSCQISNTATTQGVGIIMPLTAGDMMVVLTDGNTGNNQILTAFKYTSLTPQWDTGTALNIQADGNANGDTFSAVSDKQAHGTAGANVTLVYNRIGTSLRTRVFSAGIWGAPVDIVIGMASFANEVWLSADPNGQTLWLAYNSGTGGNTAYFLKRTLGIWDPAPGTVISTGMPPTGINVVDEATEYLGAAAPSSGSPANNNVLYVLRDTGGATPAQWALVLSPPVLPADFTPFAKSALILFMVASWLGVLLFGGFWLFKRRNEV